MSGSIDPTPHWEPGELRVLVVDDEADVRLGLRLLAQSLNSEVRDAANGEQALEIAAKFEPHLVLSDINMPGMSGVELLARLKGQQPDARTVLITGFGTIELAVEAMRHGAGDFFEKPWDNERVLAILRTQIELRRALLDLERAELEGRWVQLDEMQQREMKQRLEELARAQELESQAIELDSQRVEAEQLRRQLRELQTTMEFLESQLAVVEDPADTGR